MSDVISRADAIEAVHKYFVDKINNEPHEIDEDGDDVFTDMKSVNALFHHNKMVSKAIKALPSADAEWIPCSERLPSESGEYLCTIPLDEVDTYTEVLTFHKGRFYEDDAEWGATYYDDVLAWMPLPKPYREDDEPQFYTEDDYWNGMFAESAEAYKAWTGEEMVGTSERQNVSYICDKRRCDKEGCSNCGRTTDIEHAKNFELINNTYYERW